MKSEIDKFCRFNIDVYKFSKMQSDQTAREVAGYMFSRYPRSWPAFNLVVFHPSHGTLPAYYYSDMWNTLAYPIVCVYANFDRVYGIKSLRVCFKKIYFYLVFRCFLVKITIVCFVDPSTMITMLKHAQMNMERNTEIILSIHSLFV